MRAKTITKVDKTGRVYLPRALREAVGISTGSILDIQMHQGKLVLKKRLPMVAKSYRGIFKLKVHVKDVDREIRRCSLAAMELELNEIRRH